MANDLPRIGVQATVLDADRYFSILEKIEASTAATSKALEKQAEKTQAVAKATSDSVEKMNPLSKILSKLDDQFGGVGKKAQAFANDIGIGGDQVAALADTLGISTTALAAVAAGAAIAAAAVLALGVRGASLIGLSESFDRLNQAIGVDAVASLQRLRVASAGTVSDFDLIRQTNMALAGATGEFGREFGEKLPKLLEIARVQARATGQDVDYLFQSLVLGVKRASPKIIDNTGLVLNIAAANAAYAASIGKTVQALTEEDKQIALLNATLASGQTAIDNFAGIQETAAEKMARMNAIITNMLDTLAIGVQPAFGIFLDVINRVLAVVGQLVLAITPLISSFLEAGAAVVNSLVSPLLDVIEPVAQLVSWFITLATVLIQPVLNAIKTVANAFSSGFRQIITFIGGIVKNNFGLDFNNLALNFGRGAGLVFAAFYNAMMEIANTLILPGVIAIATMIADFLVGESPPPKGPLSHIDEGGAAVMTAWAEGFAGASLEPVEQVAANVNAALGDIGKMSLPVVQARLAQLDAALQPFNDQLAIVKANFDAINEPAKAALDSINRQMDKAAVALAAGQAGSAEMVRALDMQREKIEGAVGAQQDLLDQATIQKALAASQQASERSLLTIQQARLKAQEDGITLTDKAAKAATGGAGAAAPKAGGAGAADVAPVAGGGGGAFDAGLPSATDLLSGQSAVNQMGADIGTGFQQGIVAGVNQGQQAALTANQSALNAQVTRIGQANIGQRIGDAFANVASSIQIHLQEAALIVTDWVDSIVNPAREGSIPYAFQNFNLTTALGTLNTNVSVGLANVTTTVSGFVTDLLDPANVESVQGGLTALAANMPTVLQPLILAFSDNFGAIQEDIATWLSDNFDPGNINSIPGNLALLPTRIGNALSDLPGAFNDSVLVPIQDTVTNVGLAVGNFFTGTGDGTLKGFIDGGVAWFTALPQRIFNAMQSIGGVFFSVLVTPLVGGVNLVIEAIEGMINNTLSALGTLIGSLQGVAEAVGLGDQLAEMQASLVGGINLPRISMPMPPAATFPGAASGGLFGVRTHKNEQVFGMQAGQQMSVFPANVTRNLDLIASVLGGTGGGGYDLPMSMAGGGSSYGDTINNNNFNVNNPPSSGNFVQQTATLLSMKRGRG